VDQGQPIMVGGRQLQRLLALGRRCWLVASQPAARTARRSPPVPGDLNLRPAGWAAAALQGLGSQFWGASRKVLRASRKQ